MSAALLRRAVEALREHAYAATPGDWQAVGHEHNLVTPSPTSSMAHAGANHPEDAAYIALMSPDVAIALALLLEKEAEIRETQPRGFYEVAEADPLALLILGETA